jgi:hypothetical protein
MLSSDKNSSSLSLILRRATVGEVYVRPYRARGLRLAHSSAVREVSGSSQTSYSDVKKNPGGRVGLRAIQPKTQNTYTSLERYAYRQSRLKFLTRCCILMLPE